MMVLFSVAVALASHNCQAPAVLQCSPPPSRAVVPPSFLPGLCISTPCSTHSLTAAVPGCALDGPIIRSSSLPGSNATTLKPCLDKPGKAGSAVKVQLAWSEAPSAWSRLVLGVLATLTQCYIFVFVEMNQKNEGKCLQTHF